ncbi:hypothetical protein EV126DRAFT_189393 [Verticillium dahliae]|nr:hypothetical protein EV126DRAFT_189393 [Verticillium dahliae]
MPAQDNFGRGLPPAAPQQAHSYFPPRRLRTRPLQDQHHCQCPVRRQQLRVSRLIIIHTLNPLKHGSHRPNGNLLLIINIIRPITDHTDSRVIAYPAATAATTAATAAANQQRMSLSSFSGKKTTAWLKKNVSPHLTEVAKSSLVKGSIKELENAYTAAKGMSARYSSPLIELQTYRR